MNLIIVSIKDKVTGEHLSPIYVHNTEEAKRVFAYQIESNQMWKDNAEQFEMYKLGNLDTTTGTISDDDWNNVIKTELICKGTDLFDKPKN